VASLAGVSSAIVSAVVNSRPAGNIRVSDATRQRVMEAVRELGYVPNIAARNLARGRNHIIGIFSYESVFPLESMNFYHEFLIGIDEAAEVAGYNLLMFSAARDSTGSRAIYPAGINSLQLADGSVLMGTHERPDEIARLTKEQYPFVIIGRRTFPGASYVAADYAAGTSDATRALAKLEHRRIAYVQGPGEHESTVDRRAGFARARRRAAAADSPIRTLENDAGAGRIVTDLVADGTTAMIAESTAIATVLRTAARRRSIRIPQQLSLLDLGGSPTGDTPPISTLDIPRREMGRESVRLLLRLLGGEPTDGPLQVTLPCAVRLTDSVAPPPSLSPHGHSR
jgi:DNA-binding LacI/PurR family transcriptional regulator